METIFYLDPDGGYWIAQVANAEILYYFRGETTEQRFAAMKILAHRMKTRGTERAVIEDTIDTTLDIEAAGMDSETVYDQLFSTSADLLLNEELVFDAAAGSCLGAELVEAGEFLLSAILAL